MKLGLSIVITAFASFFVGLSVGVWSGHRNSMSIAAYKATLGASCMLLDACAKELAMSKIPHRYFVDPTDSRYAIRDRAREDMAALFLSRNLKSLAFALGISHTDVVSLTDGYATSVSAAKLRLAAQEYDMAIADRISRLSQVADYSDYAYSKELDDVLR